MDGGSERQENDNQNDSGRGGLKGIWREEKVAVIDSEEKIGEGKGDEAVSV